MEYFPLKNQLFYASGSAAFTMLERIILLYLPFYYLPPKEYQLNNLIPDTTYFGFFTLLGVALLLGRLVDGLADPVIASLSDNNRSKIGRRKIFLILGGLPLALSAVLVFFPPSGEVESLVNGVWLSVALLLFYSSFTVYVNPYLALLPELGHSDHLRINLGTFIAFFGLLGMIFAAVALPETVNYFQNQGFLFRPSYRMAIVIFAMLALILLFIASFSFKESKHCLPVECKPVPILISLRATYRNRSFRIFLCGEMFLQFAMNLVTLGLLYYAVVLFQQGERFMVTLASLTIGGGLLSFPFVNKLAKIKGKKAVIKAGVLCLSVVSMIIFITSFYLQGPLYYLGLLMFVLAGFPLGVLTVLINPTIADLARADYYMSGIRREAMYFGARAIPLKMTIAMSGFVFAFFISHFGKDLANPLGIQLTILLVSILALLSYLIFGAYPEKEIEQLLIEEKGKRNSR